MKKKVAANPKHLTSKAILARCKKAGIEPPKVAVVCGSGLSGLMKTVSPSIQFSYKEIAGLPTPRVPGHPGILSLGYCHGVPTAVFAGRVHLYEGASYEEITSFVRLANNLGCRHIILTCAVGGISGDLSPGDVVLFEDHIFLQPGNMLLEASRKRSEFDPFSDPNRTPFVNLSTCYDRSFYEILAEAAAKAGTKARPGVLACVLGPHYETPAEVRMLRAMGAHAACMSSVAEAIYAKYLGMNVLAFGMVTNRAYDMLPPAKGPLLPSSHEEILAAAKKGTKYMIAVAVAAIRELGARKE